MTTLSSRSPAVVVGLLFSVGLALAAWNIGRDAALLFAQAPEYDARKLLLEYSTLPRLVTALIVGAALSLSGALLQQSLRNPLASPTTLGTSAGANLALALVMLFMPTLQGFGRDTIAICGAGLSACLVLALGNRRGASPLSFILAGMMVGLWCGALSAVLVLLNDRFLSGLFIWGAGSLSLQSWTVPLSLLPKVAVLALVAALMVRPMTVLELGDASASSAGVSVRSLRVTAIVIAIILSAVVTSAVGIISFVGLVAPAIARLAGARLFRQQLFWSPLIGAGLLLGTDEAVKMLSEASGAFIPTGAMTALFGAPVILLLLTKIRREQPIPPNMNAEVGKRRIFAGRGLPLLLAFMIAGFAVSLLFGRAPDGHWELLPLAEWSNILPYRWPRIVAAFAAAVMLGASGVILQRLTGNEMASPELLGISAGATTGVAVSLFALASTSYLLQVGFAAVGAFAVLGALLALAFRSGFAPERILLIGVVLTAMLDALIGFLAASGDPRAITLIAWMSGSTYLVEPTIALSATACAVLFAVTGFSMQRWLDLLPLGEATSRSVGVNVTTARMGLLVLSALMAAAATVVVGPLSFVGLVGPHLARAFGLHGARQQFLGGALAAALLMLVADWLGRMIAFPYQIPAGLIAVLVGAPSLVLVLMQDGGGSRRMRLR
jgi:ferric hydroxamate transport system permease protein